MSRVATGLGLALALGGAAALPVALELTRGGVDLAVRVPARHQVLANDSARRATETHVPAAGVVSHTLRRAPGAGIDLTQLSIDYGEVWHREVTWPTLVGPFADERAAVCGYTAHVGAGLFDTHAAGSGIRAAVHRRIVDKFPKRLDADEYELHVAVPAVKTTDVELSFARGLVWVELSIALADDTQFSARVPVRVRASGGTPVFERDRSVAPTFKMSGPLEQEILRQAREKGPDVAARAGCKAGASFGGPFGCGVGMLLGMLGGSRMAESVARGEIPRRTRAMGEAQVDEALIELSQGMTRLGAPIALDAARPGDSVTLAVRADPDVSRDGITLALCATLVVGAPRVDSSIAGSPTWGLPPPTLETSARPAISVALNADAVQQVASYAWQSGRLAKAGTSVELLERAPKEVRLAAFDFTGFSPGLPPVLSAEVGGLRFIVADVDVGRLGDHRVIAHAALAAELVQHGDELRFSARPEKVWLNCARTRGADVVLTPCLGDLLPLVRDKAAGTTLVGAIGGGEVLAKLPPVALQGMALEVSNLRATTDAQPLSVRISVDARIDARP